jgi:hypothetical protein
MIAPRVVDPEKIEIDRARGIFFSTHAPHLVLDGEQRRHDRSRRARRIDLETHRRVQILRLRRSTDRFRFIDMRCFPRTNSRPMREPIDGFGDRFLARAEVRADADDDDHLTVTIFLAHCAL